MLEQLVLHTPKTFHATIEQDLNPRPCEVTDHPSVLAHEMMVIEPGENPTLILTWKTITFLSLILAKVSSIRVTIPIDLSTRSFIPLPGFLNSRRVPPLLNQSLVLIPQRSV
jgi:hypothetical protein